MPRLAAGNRAILNVVAVLVLAGGCLGLLQLGSEETHAGLRRNIPRLATSQWAPARTAESTTPVVPSEMLLNEGFEAGRIGSGWTGFAINPRTMQPEDSDSIDIVTAPVRKGGYALKMIVQPDDAVTGDDQTYDKERCELVRLNSCRDGLCRLGEEGREGNELWYAWSIFIPTDYQYVDTTPYNYQIMGQWHDQPPPGGTATGNSPPISVHYRFSADGAALRITYGLLQTGGPISTLETPIQRGRWVDLMFHIRFSRGAGGFLEAWKDGVMMTSSTGATRLTGPNMYNDEPDYLRLGLYRGKGQTQTNTLYFDEIRIATTRAALLGS